MFTRAVAMLSIDVPGAAISEKFTPDLLWSLKKVFSSHSKRRDLSNANLPILG
jgi:hypothetical protein